MSGDGPDTAKTPPGRTEAAKSAPVKPGSPPSPAASAASRARRIGGSVAATRAATPTTPATTTPATSPAKSKKSKESETAKTAQSEAVETPAAPRRSAAKVSTTKGSSAKGSSAKVASAKVASAKVPTTKVESAAELKAAAKSTPEKDKAARRPLPRWLLWTPPAVFLAVAAVFIALIVADRSTGTLSAPTPEQRETVLAAAKNCVAATNTYRYTDVDKYEKAGLACATGLYSRQYKNAVETLVKKNAPTQKFTQLAQVNSAGVETVTGNGKQWTLLVFGQLNITNTATGKNGRVDPFAVVVTMERPKSTWVISRLRLLSAPTG